MNQTSLAGCLLFSMFLFFTDGLCEFLSAQANYDESKVPKYVLPDPLVCEDGTRVTSSATWNEKRRPEILELFQRNVYGEPPQLNAVKRIETQSETFDADLGNLKVTFRQIVFGFQAGQKVVRIRMLLATPKRTDAAQKIPVFLGYNFYGNQTVARDRRIEITPSWVGNRRNFGISENKAGEASRGANRSRWPIKEIIKRGYGVATIYYGDVDPDFDDGFKNGIHVFESESTGPRKKDAGGSIAAWAWGLSRALDELEKIADVDAKKVAVIGHSRLGKTALWAGASDQRFALVISNNSGCGGAALHRRAFGETVKRINTSFPHWFCDNFLKYNDRENACPVDQHQLIALMAPRPVYIASATADRWADPKGEFLAAKGAEAVYQLFKKTGLGAHEYPNPNKSIGDLVGYHVREGGHDIKLFDWQKFMDFADRHYQTNKKQK